MDETYRESFTLRQGRLGWQWQETGAKEFSPIYSTRQAAINAIDREFAELVYTGLGAGFTVSPFKK